MSERPFNNSVMMTFVLADEVKINKSRITEILDLESVADIFVYIYVRVSANCILMVSV
jgi:hypothetical protein